MDWHRNRSGKHLELSIVLLRRSDHQPSQCGTNAGRNAVALDFRRCVSGDNDNRYGRQLENLVGDGTLDGSDE